MPNRGLTLVEVLGGLVVMGLLTIIVVPLLMHDDGAPRRALCVQNMKQIGMSLSLYALEYDEVLPRTTEEKPKAGLGAHWTYLVQPYVRSDKIFVCPNDPAPSYTYQDASSLRKRVSYLSYINNYAIVPAHDFFPVPISALTDPAGLIAIGERRSSSPRIRQFKGWKGVSAFEPGQPCQERGFGSDYRRVTADEANRVLASAKDDKDLLIIRLNWTAHDGGSNYTFVDGHAANQELSRTLEPHRFEWGERFYPRSQPNSNCD